ncbi:MAG: calcium-binding protein [Hyphomicrobium sp.]
MPITLNASLLNTSILTGGGVLIDWEFINYMDDLVPVTMSGNTVKVDFSTNDTLNGTANSDDITTHNGNDQAFGGLGNDIFHDKGLGNDQFFGGDGFDRFYLGAGSDTANGGAGTDTVDYTGIGLSLIADLKLGYAFAEGIDHFVGIENVVGTSWNDNIKGDDGMNDLKGAGGNDILSGRGGVDFLLGGDGNDTLLGFDGLNTDVGPRGPGLDDRLYGQGGNDTLMGDAGSDWLDGGIGDDTMNGGRGLDTLIGGGGNDKMTGGRDADTFIFNSKADMPRADRITDFQHGVDKIDLSRIDANPNVAGNQAFAFDWWGTPTTSGVVSVHPGPLIQGHTGHIDVYYQGPPSGTVGPGHTWIYVETNNNKTGASILLDGHVTITASDFIL